MNQRCFIALGANLGDPVATVRAANRVRAVVFMALVSSFEQVGPVSAPVDTLAWPREPDLNGPLVHVHLSKKGSRARKFPQQRKPSHDVAIARVIGFESRLGLAIAGWGTRTRT